MIIIQRKRHILAVGKKLTEFDGVYLILYLEINAKPQSKYTEKIGIKNKKIIKIYL
jgi:hypothetical protein